MSFYLRFYFNVLKYLMKRGKLKFNVFFTISAGWQITANFSQEIVVISSLIYSLLSHSGYLIRSDDYVRSWIAKQKFDISNLEMDIIVNNVLSTIYISNTRSLMEAHQYIKQCFTTFFSCLNIIQQKKWCIFLSIYMAVSFYKITQENHCL